MTYGKRRNFVWAGITALMLVLLLAAAAAARWQVTGTAINVLTSSAYRAEIEEEYEVPQALTPGNCVDKKVTVVNSGRTDLCVRVKVEKRFGIRSEDGSLQEDPLLDPALIMITYNQKFWKYLDGYWYYTQVLSAGEKTKEPLFEQYKISEQADNRYQGKDAEIIVTMESVQAEGDGVSLWGMKKSDLGISYREESGNTVTKVTYTGKEKGFSFSAADTDLFANFKNLLPGCSRTQKITVQNQSPETVSLFLQAKAAKQDQMSEKEKKLVEKLLSEYAEITVKQQELILYQGPVGGKLDQKKQNSGKAVSLGTFKPDSRQDLIVRLSVSPDMEHEMQELCGKVRWDFVAEGEDAKMVSSIVPQTGDRTPVIQVMVLLLASAAAFLYFWRKSYFRKMR